MRNSSLKSLIIVFSLAFLSSACTSDSENNNSNNEAAIQAMENLAEQGSWIITYFFDTDHEETSNYAGFEFTFGADGSLTGTDGTSIYNGTWSITDSSGSDDSPSEDDIDFNIFFSSPPDFEELSEDWDIIQINENLIQLTHVSGGNGGTDFLTFEKN
jgi:hypothetical protein